MFLPEGVFWHNSYCNRRVAGVVREVGGYELTPFSVVCSRRHYTLLRSGKYCTTPLLHKTVHRSHS